ncbi:MAG: hypothetical protein WB509_20600 [Acetobacteraceae bacterium]
MSIRRSSEGRPVLVIDVIQHARKHEVDRFHHCPGMFSQGVGGGRHVVARPREFLAVVDPGQTEQQHGWENHTRDP